MTGRTARRWAITLAVFAIGACTAGVEDEASTTLASIAPTTTATVAATTVPPPTTTTTLPETTTTTEATAPLVGVAIESVTDSLSQPVLLLSPPGEERRLVVERTGVVWELGGDGSPLSDPFLDLRDRVNSGGIEQGLLGMAFHPEHGVNGRLFAYYYHGADTTRLVEFTMEPGAAAVEVSTEKVLLNFEQPTVRHNGGMIEFGPDGMLYLSLGEGGAASAHSQDPNTLLSSILRLDVDAGDPYAIPPDNPFANGGGAPEVWAFGLRNPWRFAIDPPSGFIYIADVGHERFEEINVVSLDEAGLNFGWIRMEASACFQRGCDPDAENLTLPVHEYAHDEGCSVTGGRVYRGAAMPELAGTYFYSDWCGGWLRSFRWDGEAPQDHTEWLTGIGQVNSFGVDSAGELYVLTWEGTVAKIVPVRDE
ncbi:MAG TPA: PQQ-dependent sugar dehydrogenase [Acidimicrobiia bacterium]|nr:PQQ-dependent sugar dehydrogenase [Acidimicrobiia bacterium]